MHPLISIVIIGLLGGMAIGLQSPMISLMSQRLGTLESAFIVHFGGAVVILIPMLFLRSGNLGNWRSLPWYVLGAGALGLIVVAGVSYMIPRVGVAASFTLLIAGQLVVSPILDHYGFLGVHIRPMDSSRTLGLVVVFIGAWLTVR